MPDQTPLTFEPKIPEPRDVPYCGRVTLHVDATDTVHCVFQARQTIPVPGPGPMTLLYPKWLPGFHSPAAVIELFAGLEIFAGDLRLAWRRDSVEMHAFHIDVPEGCDSLDVRFQLLSPTVSSQGDVAVTPDISAIHWSRTVLYPAGYFARQIEVEPSLTLPEGWACATSLAPGAPRDDVITFAPVPLDDLVDAPVLSGRWTKRIMLDEAGDISLDLVADRPELLAATDEQIAPHRALIAEADALFGGRPFERYRFLAALSEQLGGGGVEHHQSCEIVVPTNYFTNWETNAPKRDVFAHEFVHAWNGKGKRGEDSWTPSFECPIRNSLMWVYEGLTQYWGEVLAARSGLWTADQALSMLARTAAIYDNRPGGVWRPMSDTTRDPIIASRQPLPWPSWQRSEDYYSEGQLIWLDIDTLIRELSGDERSLDDFARAFFGQSDGVKTTSTYDFGDLVGALDGVAAHDWKAFLTERLERRAVGAPLEGLARGGYRLVYRPDPNVFAVQADELSGLINLRFSIGLTASTDGTLEEVIWDGPAFKAGATTGAKVVAVNGRSFQIPLLQQAVQDSPQTGRIDLTVERAGAVKTITIPYEGGPRHPHLEAIPGARRRLDEILRARA